MPIRRKYTPYSNMHTLLLTLICGACAFKRKHCTSRHCKIEFCNLNGACALKWITLNSYVSQNQTSLICTFWYFVSKDISNLLFVKVSLVFLSEISSMLSIIIIECKNILVLNLITISAKCIITHIRTHASLNGMCRFTGWMG